MPHSTGTQFSRRKWAFGASEKGGETIIVSVGFFPHVSTY